VSPPLRAAFLAGILAIAGCYKQSGSGSRAGSAGDLEERLRRVEALLARDADALEFLQKVYEQQKKQIEAEEAHEPAPDAVFAVAIDQPVQAGLVDGAPALVTVIKAFDFACPHCERMSPILNELVQEYGGKIRVVYMDRVVHDFAEPAHLAGCAAGKQGKFVAFKTAFWDKGFGPYAASKGQDRSAYGTDALVALATDLKLDVGRFKADMAGRECRELLAQERYELDKFNVDGTPTFFVNGAYISGGMDKASMRALIDEKLRIAQASGVPAPQYYDREILAKGEHKFRSKKDPKP
jgi:protein-disulfide isomerase